MSSFEDSKEQKKVSSKFANYVPKFRREGNESTLKASDVQTTLGAGGLPGNMQMQGFRGNTGPTTKDKAKMGAMQAAMGFGMGMFVGSSVMFLHGATSGNLKGVGKRMIGAGLPFGVIFGVGSFIRSGAVS
jgi:hypothetical protein